MQRRLFLLGLCLTACTTVPSSQTGNTTKPVETPSAMPTVSATPIAPLATPVPQSPPLSAEQGNLVPNPGVEIGDGIARPADWTPDFWGTQSANLSWESSEPFSGKKYLSVSVQNRTEGDAKWIFKAQKLEPNTWYEYSDYYRSDGRSRMIWSCITDSGVRDFKTVWQTHQSKNWRENKFRFYSSSFRDCNFTMMHVIDRDGYLHTDHHQMVKTDPQPLKRPLVSITFDDIWASAVTTGASELEKRGWKGSFYIAGKFTRLPDAPQYAHPDDVKKLIAAGHELGSHSNTHPLMSTLNSGDIINEVKSNYDYVKFLGATPAGIAYPFGDFSDKVETEVKHYHSYARTSLTGLNDRSADPYRLRIVGVTKETTTSELFAWIDDAEKTSTWLILLFHDLQAGDGDFEYTTPVTQYQQVIEYIERKKLTVLPVNEALKELKN
jgi:peptidoglycan/xylan/chitin deacetylase (PgdA/CDA1 family)